MPKTKLDGIAKKFFIVDQMTIAEISEKLGVSDRTVCRWKANQNWDEQRKEYIESKMTFHEKLFGFSRKLMDSIEYDMEQKDKIDAGRLYAFTKMLPMITKMKEYEDSVAKDISDRKPQKQDSLSPEFVKMVQQEILGWTPAENDDEDEG